LLRLIDAEALFHRVALIPDVNVVTGELRGPFRGEFIHTLNDNAINCSAKSILREKAFGIGWHILLWVLPDRDPALAAKPVFHDETPPGVQAVGVSVGHTLGKLPELLKDFTGYFGPDRRVESEAAMGVVVELAGS
jgi:hypothetical protein